MTPLHGLLAALPPFARHMLDAVASAVGVVWALANTVNVVTALTVIWWTIRIYEMPTVQRFLRRAKSGDTHETD